MPAFEQTVSLIPITAAAGITGAYAENMLDRPRRRRSRRRRSSCPSYRRRKASRGRGRAGRSLGFGNFSNVGM